MSIGVAILGGGIFAREEHLPAIEASSHLTLKAIWSRSLKSAQSLGISNDKVDLYSQDSEVGKNLDDLLKRTDISAVVIALPIVNQPDYVRKALLAGKHVLSEKPIADSVSEALKLINWYHENIDTSKVTWAVGENFRYLNDITETARAVSKSGRLLGFRVRSESFVAGPGDKYYDTPWRTVPTHKGGFIGDAGVHHVAAMRKVLGQEHSIVSISAYTTQLQPHLAPVDTVSAALRTKTGITGTLSMSFGTTFKGSEYSFATEKALVSCASKGKVTIGDEVIDAPSERSGVPPEIRAWGEAIAAGRANPEQSPEEALADWEIIEACLQSGEQGGKPIDLKYQNP